MLVAKDKKTLVAFVRATGICSHPQHLTKKMQELFD